MGFLQPSNVDRHIALMKSTALHLFTQKDVVITQPNFSGFESSIAGDVASSWAQRNKLAIT